jgi:hypothetical protein
MVNGTLQYSLRVSKRRSPEAQVFAQVMAKLSEARSKREAQEREAAKAGQKGA